MSRTIGIYIETFFWSRHSLAGYPVQRATSTPVTSACFVMSLLIGGCIGAPQLASPWTSSGIQVDGSDVDWSHRRYVLEAVPLTLSVANDAEFFYLCAVTTDRGLQMRILGSGMELWVDPKGGTRTYFGVRVPPIDGQQFRRESGFEGGTLGGNRRGAGVGAGVQPAVSDSHLTAAFGELVGRRDIYILDSTEDEGDKIMPVRDDLVQVQLSYERGRLVYEARVPLHHFGHPSFELRAGERPVGVALRVPVPEMPLGGQFAGEQPVPGRGGGGLDGRGGGGVGGVGDFSGDRRGRASGRARPRRVPTEPLEQWIRIQLSAGGA